LLKVSFDLTALTPEERLALREYEVISKKLLTNHVWSEIVCGNKMCAVITINEGDHLRIGGFHGGFQLKNSLEKANAIDDEIDGGDYAFSPAIGYLTSHPNFLGTGMCATVYVHLPGLVLTEQIQYLMHAMQQSVNSIFMGTIPKLWVTYSKFQISRLWVLWKAKKFVVSAMW
jgi:protein arginine kinase